ncbi:hypothetical protein NMY22_g19241 [Coprinellus aureogranulatus]|nr:hypothetical protein NMY22_g19241 [Coprinellus aureogranulatus]
MEYLSSFFDRTDPLFSTLHATSPPLHALPDQQLSPSTTTPRVLNAKHFPLPRSPSSPSPHLPTSLTVIDPHHDAPPASLLWCNTKHVAVLGQPVAQIYPTPPPSNFDDAPAFPLWRPRRATPSSRRTASPPSMFRLYTTLFCERYGPPCIVVDLSFCTASLGANHNGFMSVTARPIVNSMFSSTVQLVITVFAETLILPTWVTSCPQRKLPLLLMPHPLPPMVVSLFADICLQSRLALLGFLASPTCQRPRPSSPSPARQGCEVVFAQPPSPCHLIPINIVCPSLSPALPPFLFLRYHLPLSSASASNHRRTAALSQHWLAIHQQRRLDECRIGRRGLPLHPMPSSPTYTRTSGGTEAQASKERQCPLAGIICGTC